MKPMDKDGVFKISPVQHIFGIAALGLVLSVAVLDAAMIGKSVSDAYTHTPHQSKLGERINTL